MTVQQPASPGLTLGNVLAAMGAQHDPPIELKKIRVIRHVIKKGVHGHLQGPEDLTEETVLDYTQWQGMGQNAIPDDAEPYWVVFIADEGHRARLWGVYANGGELRGKREDGNRCFDLQRNDFLAPLEGRLVVEWRAARTWHRRATDAAVLPVLEIADRDKIDFPGFDGVLLPFPELCQMVDEKNHRYADWRAALSEVQGIYLITDSSNGKQYVGKADGAERILGRWRAYAHDGHGGNIALRKLAHESAKSGPAQTKTDHARHFVFSLLRVFGPSTPSTTVNSAEEHYKRALMSREFGLNKN